MAVKAKFQVVSVTHYEVQKQVRLIAVTDDGIPEDARYHKYTPQGEITITIDNPQAAAQFVPGRKLYVDFVPEEV